MDPIDGKIVSGHEAAEVLLASYEDLAASEALIRALVAERNRDTVTARFWTGVYELLSVEPRPRTSADIVKASPVLAPNGVVELQLPLLQKQPQPL